MPWFTLHRNYSMSTKRGHVIDFKKGVRVHVPPECIPDAVAIGAVPEVSIDVLPPEQRPSADIPPDERKKKIFAAFEAMLLRAQRGDFSASGLPNIGKLEVLTGWPVDTKERDALWQEYGALKSESEAA